MFNSVFLNYILFNRIFLYLVLTNTFMYVAIQAYAMTMGGGGRIRF